MRRDGPETEVARHVLKILSGGSAYLTGGSAMWDVFPDDDTTLEFYYDNPNTGTTKRVIIDIDAFDEFDDREEPV